MNSHLLRTAALSLAVCLSALPCAAGEPRCLEGSTDRMDFLWEYDAEHNRRSLLLRPRNRDDTHSLVNVFRFRVEREGGSLAFSRNGRVFERLLLQGETALITVPGKPEFTDAPARACGGPPATAPAEARYLRLDGPWLAAANGAPLMEMDVAGQNIRVLDPKLAARLGADSLPLIAVGEFLLPDRSYMFTMRVLAEGRVAEVKLTMLPPRPDVVCLLNVSMGGEKFVINSPLGRAGDYALKAPAK